MTGINAVNGKTPLAEVHRVGSGDIRTAADLWTRLIQTTEILSWIVDSVRDVIKRKSRARASDVIAEITGADPSKLLPTVLPSLGLSHDTVAFWAAVDSLRNLLSGRPLGLDAGINTIGHLGRIIDAGPHEPIITIPVPDDLREIATGTRTRWCRAIAGLARGCDVRLICSRVDHAWLAEYHRDDLPGVSDWTDSPTNEPALEEAAQLIDVGSRHARTLRHLADIDTQSTIFHRLYVTFAVSESRIRQILGDLADADLVSIYGSQDARKVELTQTGRQFVDDEIAPQRRLSDRVSDTPNPYSNNRVASASTREGETADTDRDSHRNDTAPETADRTPPATADSDGTATATATAFDSAAKCVSSTSTSTDSFNSPTDTEPNPPSSPVPPQSASTSDEIDSDKQYRLSNVHQTRYIPKSNTVLYEAVNTDSGINVVDYPIDAQLDRGEGRLTFENDSTLYVGAEADNPMQVWTTLALTLASEKTFSEVLTRKQLDEHDVFGMLADAPEIIHSMRNLGWIDDEIDSYPDLKKALRDAAADLRKMSSGDTSATR